MNETQKKVMNFEIPKEPIGSKGPRGHRGAKAGLTINRLEKCFMSAREEKVNYIFVVIGRKGMPWHDTVVIPRMSFLTRLDFYLNRFSYDLKSYDNEEIIDFGYCKTSDDLKNEIDKIYDI